MIIYLLCELYLLSLKIFIFVSFKINEKYLDHKKTVLLKAPYLFLWIRNTGQSAGAISLDPPLSEAPACFNLSPSAPPFLSHCSPASFLSLP